jgi:hypothetical protein
MLTFVNSVDKRTNSDAKRRTQEVRLAIYSARSTGTLSCSRAGGGSRRRGLTRRLKARMQRGPWGLCDVCVSGDRRQSSSAIQIDVHVWSVGMHAFVEVRASLVQLEQNRGAPLRRARAIEGDRECIPARDDLDRGLHTTDRTTAIREADRARIGAVFSRLTQTA